MSDPGRRHSWDRAVSRPLTPMKESRAPGLAQPGGWLAGVTMPPRPVSTWGMAWRLTARWTATVVMSAFLGAAIWSVAATPSSQHWLVVLAVIVGWLYSVLVTVVLTVVLVRAPRATRRG
ncbi:hypothetical protein ACF1AJ_19000 [Leifsonia sp. NPDC014704]|uniref:hypothetical protein n=1 Tax=Leifsonia sp. NPDC014704 TaxID=3364123 RepID=UPI0036F4AB66